MIKTTSFDQNEILRDIIKLHCPDGFELDPTFGRGLFYKTMNPYTNSIPYPKYKYDIYPKFADVQKSDANNLPLADSFIQSIIFDPPFLIGAKSGRMASQYDSFSSLEEMQDWLNLCLIEFKRILVRGGKLIIKCQDQTYRSKQVMTHVFLINSAESLGFRVVDLFILLANHRLIGRNQNKQKHARKYHSYFLVFEKGKKQ